MRIPSFLPSVLSFSVLLTAPALAQTTVNWDSAQTTGTFDDPNGWIGGTAPSDTQIAAISGAVSVTFNEAVDPADVFNRVLVANTAALQIAGDLNVENLDAESGGEITIASGSTDVSGNTSLTDGSQLTISGGGLTLGNGVTVSSDSKVTVASATLHVTGTSSISGELRLEADSDATFGDTTVASTGTVIQTGGLVTSDTLDVYGTATMQSGRWDGTDLHVREGATASWLNNQSTYSGDIILGGTASIDGNGRLAGASLALNANGASFTQDAGQLAITGETRLNAGTSFAKSDGSFTSGSFVFTGAGASFIHSGGTSTISGDASITQLGDATFTVSGGTFRTMGNAVIFGNGTTSGANDFIVSGDAFFDVDGNLSVAGNTEIVTSGTARFDVGGALTVGLGSDEVARLTIGSGSRLNTGTATIGGNGKATVSLSGIHDNTGVLNVGSASGPQSLYLINGSGDLRSDSLVLAPVSGSSARMDVGGTATITGDVTLGAATNGGTGLLRVTAGTLNAANLTNHLGSTVTHTGGTVNISGTLSNDGTYNLSGAGINAGTFHNTRTLNVNSGLTVNTLTASTVTNDGSFFLNKNLTIDRTNAYVTNNGGIELVSGAELALYAGSTLHNTGAIYGSGSFGGVSTTILDEGVLRPGVFAGEMTIVGDYTLLAGGHISIELGGLIRGSQYDHLHFQNGSPEFYGWLDVELINDFAPEIGDTFDIITGTSVLSTPFRAINVTGLDPSLMLVGENLGTTFRLVVQAWTDGGSAVPEPASFATLLGVGVLISVTLRRRRRSESAAAA